MPSKPANNDPRSSVFNKLDSIYAELPDFIDQTPPLIDPQWPPPYRFDDVGIQLYQVGADGKKLQAICDRYFNTIAKQTGSPFRINPLMGTNPGIVSIILMRYPRMYSTATGYENMGYTSQNELTFAIPVVLGHEEIPIAIGYFIPFLFVDNDMSLISGRDVIGFPKAHGKFTLSSNLSKVGGCKVATLASQGRTPNDRIESRLLFETHALAPDPEPTAVLTPAEAKKLWPHGPIDQLHAFGQPYALDEDVLVLLRESAGVSMGSYSFKQFRDAQQPTGACYQAIVSAANNIYDFHGGGFLPKTELTLNTYANLKIADALGLSVKRNKIRPLAAIWYHASFDFEDVRNLVVRAGTSIGHGRPPPHDCMKIFAQGTRTALNVYEDVAKTWLKTIERVAAGQRRGKD